MQTILDEAQAKASKLFGDRENIVEYCNACINSGLGALASHYGDNKQMADFGAFTILSVWLDSVKAKIASHDQGAMH